MTGVEIPILGYVAFGLVIAGIFGFAIWRHVTGRNNSDKK